MSALQSIDEINAKFTELENEVASIQTALRSNTAVTNQIKKDTADLLALFHTFTAAMQIGMKVTLTVGKTIQWIAGILVAIVAIYTAYYNLKFGIFISDPTIKH